jgi:SNF2 family DNA or RNA helicase
LVVAPASLLENWERELALWCPRLRVVTYHGAHKEMVRNQLEKWRYDVSTAHRGLRGCDLSIAVVPTAIKHCLSSCRWLHVVSNLDLASRLCIVCAQ